MRASLNLLKKYVDLQGISPEEIADKLTFSGLEVEELKPLSTATNLVIGQIIKCENHPSSDHLHVLNVDLGAKYGVKQIVCGAPNARVGLKVIVAMVGADLGNNFKISKSTIRGVDSDGMCCSLFELGVDKLFLSQKQIDGIEELPEDAIVGNENVLEYLGLNDYILDINVLANRSDCLAIFSLAKELGALFNREVKIPTPTSYEEKKSPLTANSLIEECPQFSIKLVKNIKVKPSPKWLSECLRSEGIRSINNIVDIGNYVMLLTGQPLHMYDIDKLQTNDFIVRNDKNCDFVALDEKTYSLNEGDIVICNGEDIGCLGGIMGSLKCAIDDNTKNVAIESANFKGSCIRRTSIRTGLNSDSSARFIKGINPYQDRFVLDLTTQLLVELADAKEIYETVRYSKIDESLTKIPCTYSYINKRLGTNFSSDEIKNVLVSLGIQVTSISDDEFVAYPPYHRIDLKCNADLSEEVIRLIGLDHIKPTLPEMVTTVGGLDDFQNKRKRIREHLIENGLHEVLTYTLISPKQDENFVVLNNDCAIKVKNPMTVDHSVVRRGLISSLLEALEYNIAHQNKNLAFFEISQISTEKKTYEELCVALNGKKINRNLLETVNYDYYDVAGLFESICQIIGIDDKRYKIERLEDSIYFHPGRSAKILLGKNIVGVIGQIHPSLSKDLGDTYILDLNLSELLSLRCSNKKMNQISRYPSMERDYAFVLKNDISCEKVLKAIKKEAHGIISDVRVFDVYQGEFLPNGFKSLAIKIIYTSMDRTLTEDDVNSVEKIVLETMNKLFGAVLRQ